MQGRTAVGAGHWIVRSRAAASHQCASVQRRSDPRWSSGFQPPLQRPRPGYYCASSAGGGVAAAAAKAAEHPPEPWESLGGGGRRGTQEGERRRRGQNRVRGQQVGPPTLSAADLLLDCRTQALRSGLGSRLPTQEGRTCAAPRAGHLRPALVLSAAPAFSASFPHPGPSGVSLNALWRVLRAHKRASPLYAGRAGLRVSACAWI